MSIGEGAKGRGEDLWRGGGPVVYEVEGACAVEEEVMMLDAVSGTRYGERWSVLRTMEQEALEDSACAVHDPC